MYLFITYTRFFSTRTSKNSFELFTWVRLLFCVQNSLKWLRLRDERIAHYFQKSLRKEMAPSKTNGKNNRTQVVNIVLY